MSITLDHVSEQIAALAEQRPGHCAHASLAQWCTDVEAVADAMLVTNSWFDRAQFIELCGGIASNL